MWIYPRRDLLEYVLLFHLNHHVYFILLYFILTWYCLFWSFIPRFDPVDTGISRAIARIIKAKFEAPWPTWRKVDIATRNLWFIEFQVITIVLILNVCKYCLLLIIVCILTFLLPPLQKTHKWLPEHENAIRVIFDHKGSNILKNTFNKIRTKGEEAPWLSPEVRAGLEAYWAAEDFQKKSATAKQNRAKDSGASLYTGGSISIAQHRDRMVSTYVTNMTKFCNLFSLPTYNFVTVI